MNRPLFLIILLVLLGCAGRPVYRKEITFPAVERPIVRVKILETATGILVHPQEGGTCFIRCYSGGEKSLSFSTTGETYVESFPGGLTMTGRNLGAFETGLDMVTFSTGPGDPLIFVNGRSYRGALEIRPSEKEPDYGLTGSLTAVNVVSIEDYLRGVVPAEIGRLGENEIEAVKAQAVAARTYTLSRLGQYAGHGYDLEASVKDQVYGGADAEDTLIDRAIRSTEGQVLTYLGEPIQAYYHANCGGMTEFVERVWDKPPEPYLVPVHDEYCSWAENFSWVEKWSGSALERNISAYLDTILSLPNGEIGPMIDIKILRRSPSGRAEVLGVDTEKGHYEIEGDKIRWALKRGEDPGLLLRSTLFDLEVERDAEGLVDSVIARGRGTGHGVGMCQTGAIGMARCGSSYKEILAHFYPGTSTGHWEETK